MWVLALSAWFLASFSLSVEIYMEFGRHYCMPKYIYKNSKMNKFGCLLAVALLFLIIPWYYVFAFVYWICHIGRD